MLYWIFVNLLYHTNDKAKIQCNTRVKKKKITKKIYIIKMWPLIISFQLEQLTNIVREDKQFMFSNEICY